VIEPLILACVAISMIFNTLGVIGLHRFPDVYTRLHAATKCTTFGSIFATIAVAAYGFGQWYYGNAAYGNMTAHAIFALLALLITNPTGAHAIARAAHLSGISPKRAVVDILEEDRKKTGLEKRKEAKGVES